MTRSLLLVVSLALLAGCATTDPKNATAYESRPGLRQTKADAERTHAGASMPAVPGQARGTNPTVVSAHFPDYPRALRRAEITGDVFVRFTVETDGSVSEASVLGSPPKELAALALAAIARWTFAPATKDGVPVRAQVTQPFRFQLE